MPVFSDFGVPPFNGEATTLMMIGSRLRYIGPCAYIVFPRSGRDFFAFA